MQVKLFQQPFDNQGRPSRFGDELNREVLSGRYAHALLCSAYATSGGTGRVGAALKALTQGGGTLQAILGVANGVTSAQAVGHLLYAGATVHGFATGALNIFHSKTYLLEGPSHAWLAVGSCNLTAEGLYRNFETMTVYELDPAVPADQQIVSDVHAWAAQLATYSGNLIALVPSYLGQAVASRLLIDERTTHSAQSVAVARAIVRNRAGVPPIRPAPLPVVPGSFMLPGRAGGRTAPFTRATAGAAPAPAARGALVWEKVLPASDALRTPAGTNPVGGIRLTQARFQVNGATIDQTTYFRNVVFGGAAWGPPKRPTRQPQEEALVAFDVTVLGTSFGTRDLLVSHKPTGEAGQHNYTTILHWGPLAPALRSTINVTGRTVRLYAPAFAGAPFGLEVV